MVSLPSGIENLLPYFRGLCPRKWERYTVPVREDTPAPGVASINRPVRVCFAFATPRRGSDGIASVRDRKPSPIFSRTLSEKMGKVYRPCKGRYPCSRSCKHKQTCKGLFCVRNSEEKKWSFCQESKRLSHIKSARWETYLARRFEINSGKSVCH